MKPHHRPLRVTDRIWDQEGRMKVPEALSGAAKQGGSPAEPRGGGVAAVAEPRRPVA
jgi:hypothetical protein